MVLEGGWPLDVVDGLGAPNRLEVAAGAVVVGAAVDVEEGAAGLNWLGNKIGAAGPVVEAAVVG